MDWQCFYNAKKGAMFSRDNRWTNAAKMGQEEWYKLNVRPALDSEVRNRLAPAKTEKPV